MKAHKIIFIALFLIIATAIYSQDNKDFIRKGFVLASSVGGGVHFLNEENYGRFSIPNFKIGAMVNPKLGILLYVPGGTYKQKGEDRAFEGFFPTVQYWFTGKFYVNAGIGLAVETTPFYKVDYSQGPPKFNTGFGYTVSTGKEIIQWSTNKTVDIQIRLLYGNITYQDSYYLA